MADPHLKTQIKFTWNEFCIYTHSQDNNQPSPKDSSRQWFFLTQNFSPPVCYPKSIIIFTLSRFPINSFIHSLICLLHIYCKSIVCHTLCYMLQQIHCLHILFSKTLQFGERCLNGSGWNIYGRSPMQSLLQIYFKIKH